MSKLKLQATDGSAGTVSLKAPASTTGNAEFELTLPGNAGSNGQVLSTNGSGVLSWSDDNSGVSLSGSTNNTIATVTGANALVGEANLTFDGSQLGVGSSSNYGTIGTAAAFQVQGTNTGSNTSINIVNAATSNASSTCDVNAWQDYRLSTRIISGRENASNWTSGNSSAASYLGFYTNSAGTVAERLRIDSAGKVGIGETSPSTLLNLKGTAGGGATGVKIVNTADEYTAVTLDANRSGAGSALGIIQGRWNANETSSIYLLSGSDTTNKDDGQLAFYTRPSGGSVSRRLLLNENGVWYGSLYNTNTNAGLSANVFVFSNDSMGRASSSGKYKKNIETIQDSYADKILTMRPTWYQQDETTVNIQEDQGDDWGYWGFIAEEVAAIDPRLVTWKVANYVTDPSDSTKTIRTPLSEPEPDNVAYDRFVPHLVNLLKRQATKIETLETKVATLEAS